MAVATRPRQGPIGAIPARVQASWPRTLKAGRRSRTREPVGGRGPDAVRVGADLLEHGAGQLEPAGATGRGGVVGARRRPCADQAVRPPRPRHASTSAAPTWSSTTSRTPRVASRFTMVRTKFPPCSPKSHAVRTTYDVVGQQLPHGLLAGRLGPAVRRLRRERRILRVRDGCGPVEHVVGGHVHQPRPLRGARSRQQLGSQSVDAGRLDLVRLGAVDIGPRRGVDDHIVAGDSARRPLPRPRRPGRRASPPSPRRRPPPGRRPCRGRACRPPP